MASTPNDLSRKSVYQRRVRVADRVHARERTSDLSWSVSLVRLMASFVQRLSFRRVVLLRFAR